MKVRSLSVLIVLLALGVATSPAEAFYRRFNLVHRYSLFGINYQVDTGETAICGPYQTGNEPAGCWTCNQDSPSQTQVDQCESLYCEPNFQSCTLKCPQGSGNAACVGNCDADRDQCRDYCALSC